MTQTFVEKLSIEEIAGAGTFETYFEYDCTNLAPHMGSHVTVAELDADDDLPF